MVMQTSNGNADYLFRLTYFDSQSREVPIEAREILSIIIVNKFYLKQKQVNVYKNYILFE